MIIKPLINGNPGHESITFLQPLETFDVSVEISRYVAHMGWQVGQRFAVNSVKRDGNSTFLDATITAVVVGEVEKLVTKDDDPMRPVTSMARQVRWRFIGDWELFGTETPEAENSDSPSRAELNARKKALTGSGFHPKTTKEEMLRDLSGQ